MINIVYVSWPTPYGDIIHYIGVEDDLWPDNGVEVIHPGNSSYKIGAIYHPDYKYVSNIYEIDNNPKINVSFWEAAKHAIRLRNYAEEMLDQAWLDAKIKEITPRPGVYSNDYGLLSVVKRGNVYDYWGNGEWDSLPTSTLEERLLKLKKTSFTGLTYVAGLPDHMVD